VRPISQIVETCVARLSHDLAAEKKRNMMKKTRYARLYGRTKPLLRKAHCDFRTHFALLNFPRSFPRPHRLLLPRSGFPASRLKNG